MPKQQFATEAELATDLSHWLTSQGWDVYHEVSLGYASRRADLVAVKRPVMWVIETKMTLSLALLAQAYKWTQFAHFVSVAVPSPRARFNDSGRSIATHFLRSEGIGLLEHHQSCDQMSVNRWTHDIRPALCRRPLKWLKQALCEQQKRYTPGNADASYHTDFRETVQDLVRQVRLEPGITLRDAVDRITHHYTTDTNARAALAKWIRGGVIKEVRIEDGRPYRLYLSEHREAK